MKISEFLALLNKSVLQHGYVYQFGRQIRLVPSVSSPDRFITKYARCVRHHDENADPRSFYPVEAVWHCFLRTTDDQPHIPGPGVAAAALKLNRARTGLIMSAGEQYYLSELDRDLVRKVRALRRDLLQAACLGKDCRAAPEKA